MSEQKKPSKVYVIGAFDDIHSADIRFLQEANKRFGDVHVQLFSDQAVEDFSGTLPRFKLDERQYYLESIRYITQVSIIDQTLPILTPQGIRDRHAMHWVITNQQAGGEIGQYLKKYQANFSVIPNTALEGFPMAETLDDRPGTKKMVMVSGCFDWVHTGHIRFFEEVSQFGDLYVVVGHDQNLRLLKGKGHPLFHEAERRYWVQSIRFVKKALISTGNGWLDAEPEVLSLQPDIFVVNHDGDRPEKRAFFKAQGIEYKVLERKPKPGLPRRVSTELRGF